MLSAAISSDFPTTPFWIVAHAHDSGSRAGSSTDNNSYSAAKPSIPIHNCARSCRFFL
jgi:hypothetical protein